MHHVKYFLCSVFSLLLFIVHISYAERLTVCSLLTQLEVLSDQEARHLMRPTILQFTTSPLGVSVLKQQQC